MAKAGWVAWTILALFAFGAAFVVRVTFSGVAASVVGLGFAAVGGYSAAKGHRQWQKRS